MPIYEYKCEKGHAFEVIQKMSEEPLTECEECGAPVARVLHSPAVHFKGSGFYNTDYGKKKGGGNGGTSEGGGDSGESSESKPSESKPSDSKSSDSKSGDSKAKTAAGD